LWKTGLSSCLAQESKKLYSILAQLLFKFAFNPLGGSVVSLIPFYKTEIGKELSGMEVKNILKFGLMVVWSPSLILEIMFSKDGIHVLIK